MPALAALPADAATAVGDAHGAGATGTPLAPFTTGCALAACAVDPGARAALHASPAGSPGAAGTRTAASAARGPTRSAGTPRTGPRACVRHTGAALTALAARPDATMSTRRTQHRARTANPAHTAVTTGGPHTPSRTSGGARNAETTHPTRGADTAGAAATEYQPTATTSTAITAGATGGRRSA